MNKLKIFIDSTGDLCKGICDRYNIEIIPLHVNLGEKSYLDGENIAPSDVFEYYQKTGNLATSSAVTPDIYEKYFKEYSDKGYNVLYFGISPTFTSSFHNAQIAAESLENIYLIDSQSLSTGSGLLAYYAARMNEEGKSLEEILKNIEKIKSEMNGSFVLDTLKYMHKGGRCSALQAFGTNILVIKPCLEIRGGTLSIGKKYRGKIEKVLMDYIDNELKDKKNIDLNSIFITHTGVDPVVVNKLKERILEHQQFEEIIETIAGCTVSVHCGPNTLGIFYRERV